MRAPEWFDVRCRRLARSGGSGRQARAGERRGKQRKAGLAEKMTPARYGGLGVKMAHGAAILSALISSSM